MQDLEWRFNEVWKLARDEDMLRWEEDEIIWDDIILDEEDSDDELV